MEIQSHQSFSGLSYTFTRRYPYLTKVAGRVEFNFFILSYTWFFNFNKTWWLSRNNDHIQTTLIPFNSGNAIIRLAMLCGKMTFFQQYYIKSFEGVGRKSLMILYTDGNWTTKYVLWYISAILCDLVFSICLRKWRIHTK